MTGSFCVLFVAVHGLHNKQRAALSYGTFGSKSAYPCTVTLLLSYPLAFSRISFSSSTSKV